MDDMLENKKAKKPAPVPVPEMEDDAPPTGPNGKYLKPRPYKEGGKVMEHKHIVEEVKKHAAGHQHHSEMYGKHKEAHKMHHEHVKAMCGGGMAKGKK